MAEDKERKRETRIQSGKKLSAAQVSIRKEFAEHIGKVIRRNRTRLKWSEENLGNEVGVSRQAIADYELANTDISASMMALISTACGFDMREYTEYKENWLGDMHDISVKFKRLVEESLKKDKDDVLIIKDMLPPKPPPAFNYDTQQWEFDYSKPIKRRHKIKYDPPTEIEEQEFIDYMSEPANLEKVQLIDLVTHLIDKATMYGNQPCPPELKSLARAIASYIASDDEDPVRDKELKTFLRRCRDNTDQ